MSCIVVYNASTRDVLHNFEVGRTRTQVLDAVMDGKAGKLTDGLGNYAFTIVDGEERLQAGSYYFMRSLVCLPGLVFI